MKLVLLLALIGTCYASVEDLEEEYRKQEQLLAEIRCELYTEKLLNGIKIKEPSSHDLCDFPYTAFKKSQFGGNSEMNEKINHAYTQTSCAGDIDFVLTLNAENPDWNEWQQSKVVRNGRRENSFGMCQIHAGYHPEIVSNPNFYNWQWQLNKCCEMYKSGTRFYGYDARMRRRRELTILR